MNTMTNRQIKDEVYWQILYEYNRCHSEPLLDILEAAENMVNTYRDLDDEWANWMMWIENS